MDEEFHGRTNYETWVTYSWFTAEEGYYRFVRNVLEHRTKEGAIEWMKEILEAGAVPSGLLDDLERDGCDDANINWGEVYDAMMEE